MPKQLIYTSAKRGLDFGRSGYCTVARTVGMRRALIAELESISSYDFSKKSGAAVYSYRILNIQSEAYFVCSRISNCGFDYTGRTNFIAQHAVFEASEISAYKNPAHFAAAWEGWLDSWSGAPRELEESEFAPLGKPPKGNFWAECSRPENARFLEADGKFIFRNVSCREFLGLLSEAFERNPAGAWNCSFSTRLQAGEQAGQYAVILDENSELEAGGRIVIDPRNFKFELPRKAAGAAPVKISKAKVEPLRKRAGAGGVLPAPQVEDDAGALLYEYRFAIYAASALLSVVLIFLIFKYVNLGGGAPAKDTKKDVEAAPLIVRSEGSGGAESIGNLEIVASASATAASQNALESSADGSGKLGNDAAESASETLKPAEQEPSAEKKVSEFAEAMREFFNLPESFSGCEKFCVVVYNSDGRENRIPSDFYRFLINPEKRLVLKAKSRDDMSLMPQERPERLVLSGRVVLNWPSDKIQDPNFEKFATPLAAVFESGEESFAALIFTASSGRSEFAYEVDWAKVFDDSLNVRAEIKKIIAEGLLLPGDGEYACEFEIICGDAFYRDILRKYRVESGYDRAKIDSALEIAKKKIGELKRRRESISVFQKALNEKYSQVKQKKIRDIGDYIKFESDKFEDALNETFKREINMRTMYGFDNDKNVENAADGMEKKSRDIREALLKLSKKLKEEIKKLNAEKPNEFFAEFDKLKKDVDEELGKLKECDDCFCNEILTLTKRPSDPVFSKTISQIRESLECMDWAIKKYFTLKDYEAQTKKLNGELSKEFGIREGDELAELPEISEIREFLKGKRAGLRIYKNKKKSKGN